MYSNFPPPPELQVCGVILSTNQYPIAHTIIVGIVAITDFRTLLTNSLSNLNSSLDVMFLPILMTYEFLKNISSKEEFKLDKELVNNVL